MPFPGNQGFVEVFTFRPHVGGGRALYFEWAALILGLFNLFKSKHDHLFELELGAGASVALSASRPNCHLHNARSSIHA